MSDFNKDKKRQVRRHNHIAKDLRTPKYRERSVPKKLVEDEEERRLRRYRGLDIDWVDREYDPLMYDEDE